MAPMSNPDPMPVEVIRALALDGALLDELGEITELIGFTSALRCLIYRQLLARLKQAAYQEPSIFRAQACLSTTTPEIPTLRARAANSLAGNSARTSPFAGLTCWM